MKRLLQRLAAVFRRKPKRRPYRTVREGSFTVLAVDEQWRRTVYLFITENDEDRDIAKQQAWTGALA